MKLTSLLVTIIFIYMYVVLTIRNGLGFNQSGHFWLIVIIVTCITVDLQFKVTLSKWVLVIVNWNNTKLKVSNKEKREEFSCQTQRHREKEVEYDSREFPIPFSFDRLEVLDTSILTRDNTLDLIFISPSNFCNSVSESSSKES